MTFHDKVFARWRPAAFAGGDSRILSWALVALALARGADYLRTPQERTPSLALIERTIPLIGWSFWFLIAGCVLASGLIFKRHFPVWLGHGALAIAYTVLAIGLALPLIDDSLLGIRTAAQTGLIALLHWLIVLRTGVTPLPRDATPVVERVQGDH